MKNHMFTFGSCLLLTFLLGGAGTFVLLAQSEATEISGRVTDPQSNAVANARVTLDDTRTGSMRETSTDAAGNFALRAPYGLYTVNVAAAGFEDVTRTIDVSPATPAIIDIQLGGVAQKRESITVVADVKESSILFPDPAQR